MCGWQQQEARIDMNLFRHRSLRERNADKNTKPGPSRKKICEGEEDHHGEGINPMGVAETNL
jgi:hypothetical protein